ncbi:hypothetical protein [Clostridium botulinum]|uniref:hypothetical protein n=1 Tax=Clostridium botulinum TaxID=1491 RepID=UPI0004DA50FE|nr:hypothetical protein [Clostridium botulinum]KEH99965.1 hypothetical protein Z952_14690 [Clostridium botulinum C/D str. BKT75002]KEI05687.1 hypothetical protein Z954_14870 [Clostridium botulinum C/D str. BKT2873]MCD3351761.1 hypothetical protein [Clostridium botulinum D/C]MCD3360687.1 hypothetical protein [Clostridium botulinum D/C]MCD3362113.1 hypothetical protein [Clostridium botulinum D/C]
MSLPSYVINFDELVDALGKYLMHGVKVDIGNILVNTDTIEGLLTEINNKVQNIDYTDLINALNALGVKLDNLSGSFGVSGTQKIYGKMLKIPSLLGEHIIKFQAPRNGKISGITYSLSAWNYEDSWNLIVGQEKIFDEVTTKEYGEHKNFNVFYPINSGQEIKFIFNNNSASYKMLWVDFNILED